MMDPRESGTAELLELRAVGLGTERTTEADDAIQRDLLAWRLIDWTGGFGRLEDGSWGQTGECRLYITAAGMFALRAWELGQQKRATV